VKTETEWIQQIDEIFTGSYSRSKISLFWRFDPKI